MVYIGSDSWSGDAELFRTYHSKLFSKFIGVGVYTKEIIGIKDYLKTLNATHYNGMYDNLERNFFLDWYEEYRDTISTNWAGTIDRFKLDDHSSTTADAAYAFGQGLFNYVTTHGLNSTYETDTIALLEVLKSTNFTGLTGTEVTVPLVIVPFRTNSNYKYSIMVLSTIMLIYQSNWN